MRDSRQSIACGRCIEYGSIPSGPERMPVRIVHVWRMWVRVSPWAARESECVFARGQGRHGRVPDHVDDALQ